MKNSKTHFKKAVLKLIQAHTSRSYQVFSPDMKRYLAAGHTSSLQSNQKRISTQVVGQVSQADCCCCPQETDASQYRITCTLGLDAKDMLNPGTSLCASPIPLFSQSVSSFCENPSAEYALDSPSSPTSPFSLASDRQNQPRHLRWYSQDQAVLQTRCCHALPHCSPNNYGSTCVSHQPRYGFCSQRNSFHSSWSSGPRFFLAALVIAPVFWLAPSLDLLIFLTTVALGWYADNVGINYLSFLCSETFFQQKGVDSESSISTTPALVRSLRNRQMVVQSGTLLAACRPRNRENE